MFTLTYTLCLGVKVTFDEMTQVVQAEGGRVVDPQRAFLTLQKGKDILYILGPHCSPQLFDYDDERLDATAKVLGVRPVAFVSLDSHIEDGTDLAFGFASKCMARWPCVLDDLSGNLLTSVKVAEKVRGSGY